MDLATTRTIVAKTFVKTEIERNEEKFSKYNSIDLEAFMEFFSKKIVNVNDINPDEINVLQLKFGFKNSFTCKLFFKNNFISIKICKNISLQLTGKITLPDAYVCFHFILDDIQSFFKTKLEYEIVIYEVMINYKLDFGKIINSKELLFFINQSENETFTAFHLPKSISLNCKHLVPVEHVLNRSIIIYDNNCFQRVETFSEFFTNKQIPIKIKEYNYTTFLIYKSGKVVISGMCESILKQSCKHFQCLMNSFFLTHNSEPRLIEDDLNLTNKKKNYEKLMLLKNSENTFIIVRGQFLYISSRLKLLRKKYDNIKIIYHDVFRYEYAMKDIKEMIKKNENFSIKNVHIISKCKNQDEELVSMFKTINI
jgi:uncharacterized protein YfkK (UPF0435 family)